MTYSTKVTSKGTVTLAAPIRKALGIKPGQELSMSISREGHIVLDPGTSMAEFIAYRDKVTKKIPANLRGLSGDALRKAAAKAWVSGYHE
jgi:AbrB family looped-hinge helix DNA binding protein